VFYGHAGKRKTEAVRFLEKPETGDALERKGASCPFQFLDQDQEPAKLLRSRWGTGVLNVEGGAPVRGAEQEGLRKT